MSEKAEQTIGLFLCLKADGIDKLTWLMKKNERSSAKAKGKHTKKFKIMEEKTMGFFTSAVGVLQTLVIALGAGLGIWGAINLLEGYGNDNPGAKSQGMKQLMAGGGVALIGTTLVPLLAGLF